MWWRLFLFVVMCQCSFSTCQRYEYHFINESKTWHEAQSYCREKYTDLAKVYNMTDMERLQNSAGSSAGGWIGLYSNGGDERKWHWSQPGEVYSDETANWNEGEPNDAGGDENCVGMNREQKWWDFHCSLKQGFICYNESSMEKVHWINEAKTWIEAQSYCREHHTDLVSGDQLETLQTWWFVWIGLFRDTWLWSDGSNSSFRHWESFQSGQEQKKCAFLKGSGKWDSTDCSKSRSFFCYEGQCSFSTCQYHFIDEKKTWHESQSYCRRNYTDLAKVYNMTDMKRLQNSAGSSAGAWIGLYSNEGGEEKWHWSQPGEVYSENTAKWEQGEPNNVAGRENCVRMHKDKTWGDVQCSQKRGFICYDGSSSEEFHWINEAKTWIEAQSYCRENHTDLVSGDQLEILHNWMYWWIGLFRDTWLWSDGSNSSFRHWESFQSGQEQNKCAFLKGSGKWDSADCSELKSFFCYEENMILIQQNLTWDEAVDYCREHHHDLVSITNPEQQRSVEQRAKKASTPYVWLGLRHSCTLEWWVWVSNKLACYHNWAPEMDPDECYHRAAMEKGGDHLWVKRNELDMYNFICVL